MNGRNYSCYLGKTDGSPAVKPGDADLLATQREIATTLTEKLQLKLSGDESKGITKRYSNSNEAYQLYLRGRFYWNKRTSIG